ncbi:hypothetical protein BJ165DRAFT_1612470 [Panaeolus papilionaceus]|nr:hypothetical protein BJ165DRAFT_1612470 [Panaeolus papilionaceus]
MGPTGAGKSSFIEALGLKGSSKISSNGLDGYTQAIYTYKLKNVTWIGNPIYLVDPPGFADTKISEMAIVSMLQKWMKHNNDAYFNRILYLTPITSTRLSGTQRQVLKTFHALTGVKTAEAVTIVTTMWDNIWGENATKRAEDNYQQLQNDIWKDFIDKGAQMTQYHNTQTSALSILDQAFASNTPNLFSIEDHQKIIKGSPFEANLITDLQDRIQNLQSHIPTLHDELAHAKAEGDKLLLSTLHPRLQEAKEDLAQSKRSLTIQDSCLLLPILLPPLPWIPNLMDPELVLDGQTAVRENDTPDFSLLTNPLSLPPLVTQIMSVPDVPPITEVVTLSIPPFDLQRHIPSTHDIATPSISRPVEEGVGAELQQPAAALHALWG